MGEYYAELFAACKVQSVDYEDTNYEEELKKCIVSHNEEKKTSRILNAIPISLVYQIDVYARLAIEADILMRNLVFNIINYPAFEVDIPDAGFCHTARIEFASNTIDDNSNEPERFIEGNFTKLSAKISIEDAYLWDVRQHRDAEIEIKIDDTYENRNYR